MYDRGNEADPSTQNMYDKVRAGESGSGSGRPQVFVSSEGGKGLSPNH